MLIRDIEFLLARYGQDIEWLSKNTGISINRIEEIIGGRNGSIRFEEIGLLTKYLNCDINALFSCLDCSNVGLMILIRIKQLLRMENKSIDDFCKENKINISEIKGVEIGAIKYPSIEIIMLLCKDLDISISYFFSHKIFK